MFYTLIFQQYSLNYNLIHPKFAIIIKFKIMKSPLSLRKEDLHALMNIPLRIGIGPVSSNLINEVLDGKIIHCSLSANYPHLPVKFKVQTSDSSTKSFLIFEIKYIEEN